MTDRDRALDCLSRLAAWRAEDRQQHYRVGMALKSVADDLYAAWLDWSKQASNFNEKYCRSNWRSFKADGKITLGTLIHMARQDSGDAPGDRDAASERLAKLRAAKGKAPSTKPSVVREWGSIMCNALLRREEEPLCELAESLGLSVESLRHLGIGWWAGHDGIELRPSVPREHQRGWTFPMMDWNRMPIGIRLRLIDDDAIAAYDGSNKIALPGSSNGLFIAKSVAKGDGTLVIVEGPTDCAAVLDMGMACIGRPSNTAGTEQISWFVKVSRPATDRVVILIDRDQPNSDVAVDAIRSCVSDGIHEARLSDELRDWGLTDAERTTAQGAIKLQRELSGKREVCIAAPPLNFKDARDWRKEGAGADDLEDAIERAVRVRARAFDWMRNCKGAA